MKAIWNDQIIAESADCIELEGNYYFPRESVNMQFLKVSKTKTHCPWKGEASYFDVEVDGKVNPDAAWSYESPKHEANEIKDHIAFWKGVQVRK